MGQAAEHLLCKYKALSSNSSLTKKKKEKPINVLRTCYNSHKGYERGRFLQAIFRRYSVLLHETAHNIETKSLSSFAHV
jgi:primosomal protein N''